MLEILTIIAVYCSILAGLVLLYEYLTDDNQKRDHKQKLSHFLKKIHSMRSLVLAQNDANLVLSWMNRIYGKPSKYRFFARDFWGRRPVLISIVIATLYIEIAGVYVFYVESIWILYNFLILFLFFVPINTFLDLVSVNASRILFFKMTKSCNVRTIVFLILLDFVIAFLLYLTGPAWMAVLDVFFGEDFTPMFLDYFKFWNNFTPQWIILFGAMFLTTLVPTVFHLLLSFVFFSSKAVAQPVRICFEKTIEHMIRLPKGVTALFSFVGVVVLSILAWIISTIFQ